MPADLRDGLLHPARGPESPVNRCQPETATNPDWSPDSHHLVYGSQENGLFRENEFGGEFQQLIPGYPEENDVGWRDGASWSPDGARIVVRRFADGGPGLWLINKRDGSGPVRAHNSDSKMSPTGSPSSAATPAPRAPAPPTSRSCPPTTPAPLRTASTPRRSHTKAAPAHKDLAPPHARHPGRQLPPRRLDGLPEAGRQRRQHDPRRRRRDRPHATSKTWHELRPLRLHRRARAALRDPHHRQVQHPATPAAPAPARSRS